MMSQISTRDLREDVAIEERAEYDPLSDWRPVFEPTLLLQFIFSLQIL